MRLDPRVKERLKQTFMSEMASEKLIVRIVSTYRLTPEEQKSIVSQFPQFVSSQIENIVDPSIIGGFVLMQGSQAIDLSIRSVLQTLQKSLV